MTAPKHPGSRVVDQQPSLANVIRRIEAEISRIANRTRPETLTFVASDVTKGVPQTSGSLASTMKTLVYRSGDKVFADVLCGTGAGSVMEVRLSIPSLSVAGASVTTASGGTEQIVRLTLAMPDSWDSGAAQMVHLEARRVSGADTTTVQVLRGWQR